MADPRSIHEFTTGQVEATTLLLGDFVDLDAQSGYTTLKMSVSDLGEVLLEDIEYTQDLQTVDKTVIGAINENKSVIGYNYDEYDDTTTSANAYAVDDLCIHNNTLYKCIAPTYGAWDSSKWEPTSIADEIGRIDTALSGKTDNTISSLTIESNTKISQAGIHFLLFGKIITLSGVFRAQNTQIMAQETIWTIKNHNLVGQSTDQYYIPLIVDNESGYLYLVAQNDGNDIKIFSNANLQMPRLMFFNGVLPIV